MSLDHTTRSAAAAALLAAAALAGSGTARADGLTVLHSFDYSDGQYPLGRLVQGPDGRLYGSSYAGGTYGYGTVFAVTPAGAFQIVHSFSGSDGNSLDSGLVAFGDGNLYGSTPQGSITVGGTSTNFGGTVFQLTTQGSLFTLRSFTGSGKPDGSRPGTLVDGRDGYLYGAMRDGGTEGLGTVFKIGPDGSFGLLHSFTVTEGFYPGGGLTRASDGSFYGTLGNGPGNNANGAIFRITASGSMTVVHAFNGTDGRSPGWGLIEAAGGDFYGVTGAGGPSDAGTVFRMAADGSITTLHAFNGVDGAGPVGGLALGPDGNFYGLSAGGGKDYGGTIFRITLQAQLTTLRVLQPPDGLHPPAAPIFGSDGMLYGTTTQYGGAPGASGSVFKFDALAPQPATLAMQKFCYNEFDICFTPINTWVGQRYTVQWSSANLDTCTGSGAWAGSKPTAGALDVVPTRPGIFTYRLRCRGPSGVRSAAVTVTVG